MKLEKQDVDDQSKEELLKRVKILEDENSRLKEKNKIGSNLDETFIDSQEKFHFIFNQLNDSVFLFQFSDKGPGFFQEVNDKACSQLGYKREELLKMSIMDIAGNDAVKKIPQIIKKSKLEKKIVFETVHISKDGREIPVEISSHHFKIDNKVTILAIARDISERKKIEKALEESKVRIKAIAETANESVITIDSDGNILYWNKASEDMFGFSKAEILGDNVSIIIPEQYREKHNKGLIRLKNNGREKTIGKSIEITGLKKNGIEFPIELSITSYKLSEKITFTGIIRDITERIKMRDDLKKSEDHYRNFFDNSLVGLFRSSLSDGLILEINSKASEIFGLEIEEIIEKISITDLWKDPDQRRELLFKLKQDGEVNGFEVKLSIPDGKEIIVSLSVKSYPDRDYFEGAIIDVTVHKKALEEVENLADIIRQSTDIIMLTNLKGEIEYVNPMFEEITGYTFEEVKGKNPKILRSEDNPHTDDYYKNMWDTLLKEDELGEGRQKLRIIAHGYLGNADYFGLSELTASSDKLEQAIEKYDPDQKIIRLSETLNDMIKEIYKQNK